MFIIRKPIGLIALLLAFGASVTAPTLAQAKATHNWTSTLQSVPLTTGNGYPLPGGTALLVGSAKIKPFGASAVIDRVTVTGQPEPNVFAFKGTERDFLPLGTVRNTFTGTATLKADGSQELAGSGRFTGGTGRYRGASGRYRFSGTIPPGSSVLTLHGRGTISY
jgi:hypothetical protein